VQLSVPLVGTVAEPPVPVLFVRHRRARRYILRVLADGTVRVTLPRWGVKRDAQAFLDASREWISRQQQRRAARRPSDMAWRDGTRILVNGESMALRVVPAGGGWQVWCGDTSVGRAASPANVRPTVERWLADRGRRDLPQELMDLARIHAIAVTRVSVRNQRSRWGACSPTGTITLNWRLVQTPPFVREYVLLHELMHRRELNHSRRFWRLVAACCPRHQEARRWLRTEGKSLWSDCDSR
jgi:predicted metal-dependent hydrolase